MLSALVVSRVVGTVAVVLGTVLLVDEVSA